MKDDTKRQILDEIIELTEPPHLQSGDITLVEYAERVGITRSSAKNRLQKVVDAGRLETLLVRCPDGKYRRVYRLT
jgi:DNA-binding Lrp family transcriptional regulator